MAFKIKTTEIDLGQTAIENLFITDFMTAANGTFVKVYLLGYHYAQSGHTKFNNESLAKQLDIAIEDVVNAWDFWAGKNIVVCTQVEAHHSKHNFDVQFLSIRELYVQSNFPQLPETQQSEEQPTQSDRVFSAMSNPIIKEMLAAVQYIVRRMLTPQETTRILDWMTHYKMDPDMIERAFFITYEERKIQDFQFNYVEGILVKWYDKRILSMDALEAYAAEFDQRHLSYKQIYQALGVNNRTVSAGDKEVIDRWFDDDGYDLEFLIFVIKEATKRTLNPNMNYMQKVIQNIKENGDTTIEGATQYFEAKKNAPQENTKKEYSKSVKKTKFQNFDQTTIADMSQDEMQEILKRKAQQRLANRGKKQ
ncbi:MULTISPECIES: DnaD domain protein [unclassified Fusibacter]|uniref:DnaD domain protein n=1 Tax=unclassified Fusibacter TaxID=2624464 RepID=UPI001011E8EB|nr:MULTISPECIES: DnaD domain protein [unclassified Fusibacter]MCK8060887.1 DnaD domain protein [Fusibacter sp. A2]NPE23183.1 DnaD domain protein [Fusibacter sp. A1]RXV59541.1 DnaD domain protein [Fusibacter sp. A1]